MNIIVNDIFCFRGTGGGGVFVNEVLQPNQMVDVKDKDNIECCELKLFVKMIKQLN